MRIAADTCAESDAVQLEAYRRLGGSARAQAAFRLSEAARRASEAGIRRRHPEYDDDQAKRALARLLYGDELVRSAWPGRELLDP